VAEFHFFFFTSSPNQMILSPRHFCMPESGRLQCRLFIGTLSLLKQTFSNNSNHIKKREKFFLRTKWKRWGKKSFDVRERLSANLSKPALSTVDFIYLFIYLLSFPFFVFCSSIAVDLKLYLSSSLFPSDNKRVRKLARKAGRRRFEKAARRRRKDKRIGQGSKDVSSPDLSRGTKFLRRKSIC